MNRRGFIKLALEGLAIKELLPLHSKALREAYTYGKALSYLRKKRNLAKRVINMSSKRFHQTHSQVASNRAIKAAIILDRIDNKINDVKPLAERAHRQALALKKSIKGLSKANN